MDSDHDTGEGDLASQNATGGGPVGPGEQLRSARLAKGLELDFIAAETRIPVHHLEALENEDFEHMPARAYAIGFARNYARAVGLDENAITEAVRTEMAYDTDRRASVVGGMEPGDPAKLPSAGLAWFGAFAAILLATGVYAFYNTYYASGPGLGSLLAGEETEGEGESQAAADAPDNAISPDGQVVFTALDDEIWVRFFVEGGDILFETTMQRGDSYEVPRNVADVRLNTGRPQFLEITIDGQEVPKLAEEQVTLIEPVTAAALLARFGPVETDAPNDGATLTGSAIAAQRPAQTQRPPQTATTPQAASTNASEETPSNATQPAASVPASVATTAPTSVAQPTEIPAVAEPEPASVQTAPPANETPLPAQEPPGAR
ncbi:MAG: RodZ domain-containing protein [Pseudomonadota bacterium]